MQALSWPYQHGRDGGWSEAMKRPMFAIETDPVEGLSIVLTRPDGTRVVIRGGQYSSTLSDTHTRCSQLASFLDRNAPLAP
jgi:hypothetical protein